MKIGLAYYFSVYRELDYMRSNRLLMTNNPHAHTPALTIQACIMRFPALPIQYRHASLYISHGAGRTRCFIWKRSPGKPGSTTGQTSCAQKKRLHLPNAAPRGHDQRNQRLMCVSLMCVMPQRETRVKLVDEHKGGMQNVTHRRQTLFNA